MNKLELGEHAAQIPTYVLYISVLPPPSITTQGVIMDFATTQNLTMLPLLRVLRVLRIIKIIPKARGLRLMLETLRWSLPALFNVASVLLLFMFVYVSYYCTDGNLIHEMGGGRVGRFAA